MECKNCGQNLEGNFCKNCGQSSNVRKINFQYIIEEIPNSIFQVNRGLLFTIKELFYRPGHSIRDFLQGKRKNYFKPVAYILLLTTIYATINYLIGNNTFFDDAISGMTDHRNSNKDFAKWLSSKQTYIPLILTPIFAFASYLAFFKSGYNYFEHLILNFYITGQQMLIYLAFSFIYDRAYWVTTVPVLLGMIYNFWTYSQFFNKKGLFKKMALILLTYIIFFSVIILLMISIAFIMKY